MAVVLTGLACPALTEPLDPDGATSYAGIGILLLTVIGGFYWHELGTRLTALLIGATCVTSALVPALSKGPFDIRAFLCVLALCLAPFPMCRQISRSLAGATERDHADAVDEHLKATEVAFSEGQESVLTLVRLAHDDAKAQLADLAITLEPDLAALVGSRLDWYLDRSRPDTTSCSTSRGPARTCAAPRWSHRSWSHWSPAPAERAVRCTTWASAA